MNWLLTFGSVFLALFNVTTFYLLERKRRVGWIVQLSAQPFWTVYEIITKQYGLVILTVVYTFIAVRGFRSWRPDTRGT